MLDHLRSVVGLRGYAQRDPLNEFKQEALAGAAPASDPTIEAPAEERGGQPLRSASVALDPNDPSTWGKVGRNDACPCGSGKKYKHCHGKA